MGRRLLIAATVTAAGAGGLWAAWVSAVRAIDDAIDGLGDLTDPAPGGSDAWVPRHAYGLRHYVAGGGG